MTGSTRKIRSRTAPHLAVAAIVVLLNAACTTNAGNGSGGSNEDLVRAQEQQDASECPLISAQDMSALFGFALKEFAVHDLDFGQQCEFKPQGDDRALADIMADFGSGTIAVTLREKEPATTCIDFAGAGREVDPTMLASEAGPIDRLAVYEHEDGLPFGAYACAHDTVALVSGPSGGIFDSQKYIQVVARVLVNQSAEPSRPNSLNADQANLFVSGVVSGAVEVEQIKCNELSGYFFVDLEGRVAERKFALSASNEENDDGTMGKLMGTVGDGEFTFLNLSAAEFAVGEHGASWDQSSFDVVDQNLDPTGELVILDGEIACQ